MVFWLLWLRGYCSINNVVHMQPYIYIMHWILCNGCNIGLLWRAILWFSSSRVRFKEYACVQLLELPPVLILEGQSLYNPSDLPSLLLPFTINVIIWRKLWSILLINRTQSNEKCKKIYLNTKRKKLQYSIDTYIPVFGKSTNNDLLENMQMWQF